MHVLVFPAIAKVAFKGVKRYHPAFVKQTEILRCAVIVLVYLGQAMGKIEFLMKYGVRERQFNQFTSREQFLQLRADKLIHAVIIISMQKAAAYKISTQVVHLLLIKHHIAVACHMHKGVIKQLRAAYFHRWYIGLNIHSQVLITILSQVGHGSGICIPVSSPIILKQSNFQWLIISFEGCRHQYYQQ